MKEPVGLSPPRLTILHLLFVFIIKDLKSFVLHTFLLLLFRLNFWNLLWNLIGYRLRMLWPMNGDL